MKTQEAQLLQPSSEFTESFGEWDIPSELLFGVIGVLAGWLIIKKIKRIQTKSDISFSVAFAMCFSGTLVIFKEIAEFFVDFFTGSNLLNADFVDDNHWLYRVFGFGMSPYEQRPLLDTDEDMLISFLSALLTGAFLYVYLRKKNKALYIKEKAGKSLQGMKEKVKNKISIEKEKLRKECSIADMVFWWCTRILMIYAFVIMENRAEANLILANLVATFTITIVHFIFPSNSFFSKISYRTQTLVTVMVFLGSYCGNYVMVYNIVPRFDLFLHFISGAICVFAGYYIAKTLVVADSKTNALLIAIFSLLFSCMVMPAWEITEFIGDFIWGTSNQGFYWGPTEDSFFFVLFGTGVHNTALYPLFDTFYDVLLALSTTIPAAAVLYGYLSMTVKKKCSAPGDKEKIPCGLLTF